MFFVSGDTLFEIDSAGTATNRGTLSTATNRVSLDENGTEVMIVDGANGYIFTLATNGFAAIADADFPGGDTVTFQDGYFIVNKPDSAQFYISALYDGTNWAAADNARAQADPDNR